MFLYIYVIQIVSLRIGSDCNRISESSNTFNVVFLEILESERIGFLFGMRVYYLRLMSAKESQVSRNWKGKTFQQKTMFWTLMIKKGMFMVFGCFRK